MKTSHGHAPLLIFAFMVTAVVASLYGYVEHVINSSVLSAAKAHRDLATSEADQARNRDILATYDATKADWQRLPKLMILSDDTVSFIVALESIGPKSGGTVDIGSVDADNLDGQLPATIGEARAHVSVKGSWASVMRAIILAETLPYHSTVSNVHLAGSVGPAASVNGTDAKPATSVSSWSADFDVKASIMTPI